MMQTLPKPRLTRPRQIGHYAHGSWLCRVFLPGDQNATVSMAETPKLAYVALAHYVQTFGYRLPNYRG